MRGEMTGDLTMESPNFAWEIASGTCENGYNTLHFNCIHRDGLFKLIS